MLERISNISVESIADNTKLTGTLDLRNDSSLKFNPGFELLICGLHYILADFLRSMYTEPEEDDNITIPKFYCRFDSSIPNDAPFPKMIFSISTTDLREDLVLNLIRNPQQRVEVAKKLSLILDKWIRDLYDSNYERTELRKIKESFEKSACALVPLTVNLSDRDNFSIRLNAGQTNEIINKMINERKDLVDIFGVKRLKFRANCIAIGLEPDRYFTM